MFKLRANCCNLNFKYIVLAHFHEPVEQPEELLHATPASDLHPDVGVLAELDQHPGDTP